MQSSLRHLQLTHLLGLLSIVLLIGCSPQSESANQPVTIGILSGSPIFDSAIDGFISGMAERGYIDGETVTYDIQYANNNNDLMTSISEQFVADDVDLIFTTTNAAAITAKQATQDSEIPIVFTFVIAPVNSEIVDDLRVPGGNITGVRNPLDDFVIRRIELLQQIDSDATRLWLPYNPSYPTVTIVFERLRAALPTLNIETVETIVTTDNEVLAAIDEFSAMDDLPFDAILIFPDLTVQTDVSWAAIRDFAASNNLPVLANAPTQVEQGALFSYLVDTNAAGQRAARLAGQVLNGADPATIPVETAEVSLTLNLDSAETLGLDIPADVVASAQTIIRPESAD